VGRTRVALALGAGGARGYAHIGVIEVLRERGYEIASIAGTSMGALIGGLHAAGRLDAYAEWVCGLTARQVVGLLDVSIKAPGAIRGERILAKVSELLDGAAIEDLRIPFTAVATDLLTGKEVWFQEGPVATAIRASIALPTVITPVVINGRLLADGGLTNPIPTSAAASVHVDEVIAVSLSGTGVHPEPCSMVRETARHRPMDDWLDRFRHAISGALDHEGVRTLLTRLSSPHLRGAHGSESRELADHNGTDPAGGVHLSATGIAMEDADPFAVPGSAESRGGRESSPSSGSGDGIGRSSGYEHVLSGLSMLDVVDLSLDAMQNLVTRYRLAAYPPDITITIPRTAGRTLDFHRAGELIELGRQAAMEVLDSKPGTSGAP
jgi:NTE family protein